MLIQSTDYYLIRFCERSQSLLQKLGNWETRTLRRDLAVVPLERPVFVSGLARSGTTLLLELLASVAGMATHRYRDFPFLMTPFFWNRVLDWFPVQQDLVERPHKDRIHITRESPEAFEEPIWHRFFPHVHSPVAIHLLTTADANPQFDQFFTDHIRKILLIRHGNRYVSKCNYNVARIEYVARLFPDAKFIIPVRDPVTHVHSLVRQHELFTGYAADDARVPRYLAAAGHFEFGPQRIPIRISAAQGDRILDAWSRHDEYTGYGIQWAAIYGHLDALQKNDPRLAERISVVRYEDLCDAPESTMQQLLAWLGVDHDKANRMFERLNAISKSPHSPTLDETTRARLRSEVDAVARSYGYRSG